MVSSLVPAVRHQPYNDFHRSVLAGLFSVVPLAVSLRVMEWTVLVVNEPSHMKEYALLLKISLQEKDLANLPLLEGFPRCIS